MVKAFHRAGIEVILDVVYNHTGEGNENGPTLSFRGLDNAIYYMLDREGRYYNFSGCGNTLNCNHPLVRDLIIDSLTYLVAELHVDGFRFDLAADPGPRPGRQGAGGPAADPAHRRASRAGRHQADGRGVGRGRPVAAGQVPRLGPLGRVQRLVPRRRAPLRPRRRRRRRRRRQAHLRQPRPLRRRVAPPVPLRSTSSPATTASRSDDLVSYNHKHNQANGENNRTAGTTTSAATAATRGRRDDGHVNAVRQRQMRNFLTLLLISQGVPLLTQGDEFGRTQHGNNNAYCQDNEISWVDWSLAREERRPAALHAADDRPAEAAFRGEPGAVRQPGELARRTRSASRTGRASGGRWRFHCTADTASRDLYVIFNAHWEGQRFSLPPGRPLAAAGGHEPAVAGRHRRGAGRACRCGRRTIIMSRRAPPSSSLRRRRSAARFWRAGGRQPPDSSPVPQRLAKSGG